MSDTNRPADAVSQLLARCGAPTPSMPTATARAWSPEQDDPPTQGRAENSAHTLEATLLAQLKQTLVAGPTVLRNDDEAYGEHSLGVEWAINWRRRTATMRSIRGAEFGPPIPVRIGLLRALVDSSWIGGWLDSVEPDLPRQQRETIIRQLWRRLQRTPELHHGRRLLLTHVRRIPHVPLALRLWADIDPNSDHLFFLRRMLPQIQARQRENPRLLPLLGLVPPTEQAVWSGDYAALRDYMKQLGLSEGGWKLLCRHGRRLWQGAVGSTRHHDGPLVMIAAIANALAAAGEKRIPPADVVRTIVDAEGLVVAGDELKRLVPTKFLVAATRHWRSLRDKPARRAFVQGELATTIDWWQQTNKEEANVPPRARWAGYVRRADAWRAEEAARRRTEDQAWDCGLPDAVIDGFAFVPLRSAWDLWREAQAMRNCLGESEYVKNSGRGAYALVSIRRPDGRRPLATFAAHCSGASVPGVRNGYAEWSRGDIRAFANRPVDAALLEAAQRYLDQVNTTHAANHATPRHPAARPRGYSPDLRLRFLGQRGRMLYFDLVAGKEAVALRISDALDSFASILHWLEAVTTGTNACAAYTDGEGLYRELRYSGGVDGVFRVIDGHEEPLVTGISRTDLVATIYVGLRGMLASSMGRTLEWESGNLWDRLESCLMLRPPREVLVHRLAGFGRARLNAILDRLSCMGSVGRSVQADRADVLALLGAEHANVDLSDSDVVLREGFDEWPEAMRIEALADALRRAPQEGTGTRLHWQRSPLVEAWLTASGVDLGPWIEAARAACDAEVASGLAELARRDRYGLRADPATLQPVGEESRTTREE